MIILQPNTSNQTISIMPRVDLSTAITVSIRLRRDGDGLSENIIPSAISSNGNFTELSVSSTILSEGSTYFMEIESDDNLAYRDKIFCTNQNVTTYSVNDNEYIKNTIANDFIVL